MGSILGSSYFRKLPYRFHEKIWALLQAWYRDYGETLILFTKMEHCASTHGLDMQFELRNLSVLQNLRYNPQPVEQIEPKTLNPKT